MKKAKLLVSLGLSLSMTAALATSVTSVQAKKAKMTMTASVTSTKAKVTIKNSTASGTVYAYNANEYAKNDKIRGISTQVLATGTKIGTISKGKSKTISVARYDASGRDLLYDKYYILSGNKIIKGPVYATTISSKKKSIGFTQKSIKGIFSENVASNVNTYAKDLGAQSITLNINLGNLLSPSTDGISFVSNGKTYYFNSSAVSHYDSVIKAATAKKMNVIAILVPFYTTDTASYPTALRYNSPKSKTTLGTNTSSATGRDYYIAMMEFLASRYSNKSNGYVKNYVIGNEVDFTHYFYATSNFTKYMEEYSRSLRLANLAVKKYAGNAKVSVPFSHYWTKSSQQVYKEATPSFAPKKMIDWLAKYTNARGAYDWGLAPHPYGVSLAASNLAGIDSVMKKSGKNVLSGSYKTSYMLTFSNFEILDSYLAQSSLKYKGKKRSVFLTESGASSYKMTTKDLNQQAASLAQAYYKVANLSFVKSFNYYRLQDQKTEVSAGLTSGLLKTNGKKKPAYTVYKYIDTKSSNSKSKKYLKYISFRKNGKTLMNSKKIKSWKTAMTVFTSKFNWNKKFSWKKIYKK